jgi:hypothetical protein
MKGWLSYKLPYKIKTVNNTYTVKVKGLYKIDGKKITCNAVFRYTFLKNIKIIISRILSKLFKNIKNDK